MNFFRSTILFVNLIDNYTGLQSQFNRLLQDKAGLRHRSFKGIYQKKNPIRHIEYTFYFPTKVGVTRGIDDVDLDVLVLNRNILGDNGNSTLAFQVVIVQNQFSLVLVFAEQTAVVHDFVYQGGLTVVNVCNDCNVFDGAHRCFYLTLS